MTPLLIVAGVIFVAASVVTLLVTLYLIGRQEERRVEARIKRRLREIQRDPAQWGGA